MNIKSNKLTPVATFMYNFYIYIYSVNAKNTTTIITCTLSCIYAGGERQKMWIKKCSRVMWMCTKVERIRQIWWNCCFLVSLGKGKLSDWIPMKSRTNIIRISIECTNHTAKTKFGSKTM